MNLKNEHFAQDKVIITKFKKQYASDLRELLISNSEDTSVLNHGLIYSTLQTFGLLPSATKFVAYHKQDKIPVGFITLEKNTKTLFSIKDLIVNSNYRKMGIGSQLLESAINLAKQKGAQKLNLIIYPTKSSTIELYKKLGFREIGHTVLAQFTLPGFSTSKAIKHILLKQNSLEGSVKDKKLLIEAKINQIPVNESIFDIYTTCMPIDWLSFFEINRTNLKYGSKHVWQPHLFNALISKSGDSFALLFNQPFPFKNSVEFYKKPGTPTLPLLEDLLLMLSKRGIGFTQLWLFGQTDDIPIEWFANHGIMTFNFICMGKSFL